MTEKKENPNTYLTGAETAQALASILFMETPSNEESPLPYLVGAMETFIKTMGGFCVLAERERRKANHQPPLTAREVHEMAAEYDEVVKQAREKAAAFLSSNKADVIVRQTARMLEKPSENMPEFFRYYMFRAVLNAKSKMLAHVTVVSKSEGDIPAPEKPAEMMEKNPKK